MRRTIVYALRFAAILAVLGVIPALSRPAGGASPYESALSSLAATSRSYARPSCNYKGCGGSRYNEACNPITVAGNCVNYHGFCIVSNCS